MNGFVVAVNGRGEKQRIPATWIGHPVLGKGFRLPKSAEAGVPQVIGRRGAKRAMSRAVPVPDGITPVSGGDSKKEN